jgi:flagellar basal body-associated protein FliL
MNEKEKGKEKEKEKRADDAPEKKPPVSLNKSKIVFFGIIAAAIVFNVIIAFVLIQATKPKNATEKEAQAKADSLQQGEKMHTEIGEIGDPIDAIVNVAGTDGERLLKVVVRLEFPSGKGEEFTKEMKKISPRVKNLLIDLVSEMSLVELNEPAAKDKIRTSLLRKINNTMPKVEVLDVLLDQFIIQ